MKASIIKDKLVSVAAAVLLLVLWKAAALFIHADIILPPPEKVLMDFFRLIPTRSFQLSLGATLLRGSAGFLLSFTAGIAIGILAGVRPLFDRFISPFITVVRSTPVMSVILIALMWFHTDVVPVFVVFLTAFPITVGNVSTGIGQIDPHLIEMARVYGLSSGDKLKSIVFPSLVPYILAAMENTLALTWKVVIAAEVLAVPLRAVGTGMHDAQIYVETTRVFSWTVTAVLLGSLSHLILKLLNRKVPWRHK